MGNSKKEKSPYGKHSFEDVLVAESGHYYIQLGDDMFESENGKMAFNKDRAEHFFNQLRKGLDDLKEHGTQEQKEEASWMLYHLKMYPLRIH